MTMLRSGDDSWTVASLVQRYEDAPGYASPATMAARFGALAGHVTVSGASVSLHRVRHTVATTVVALGDFDRARRRLRHHRLDTTSRHYVDTTGLDDDTEVADALETYYRAGEDFQG